MVIELTWVGGVAEEQDKVIHGGSTFNGVPLPLWTSQDGYEDTMTNLA